MLHYYTKNYIYQLYKTVLEQMWDNVVDYKDASKFLNKESVLTEQKQMKLVV